MLAKKFVDAGAFVGIADLNARAMRTTAKELGVRGYELDVTNPGSIQKCRKAFLADSGHIDILVNNAGIVFGGAFATIPLDQHRLTFEVNAIGPVSVTHAFYKDLCARPEASIVFVASASGYIGLPNGTSYASSKWAAIGFAESLRLELQEEGKRHVHVTTVCPSYIDTGMFSGAEAPLFTPMLQTEVVADAIVKAIQTNRKFVELPWIVRWIQTLRGLLPRSLFDRVMHVTGVSKSMSHWKGKSSS
ncbi:MAG: SDR family NAD(P)-dependent oxidoreductase [Leptospirales bacterium]|nr:SDR family NAD(P)-dependent oxidoreductase [Leptospirales bacterium]